MKKRLTSRQSSPQTSEPNTTLQTADLKQVTGGFWGNSWDDGLTHEIAHPTQQSSGGYWGGYDDFGFW